MKDISELVDEHPFDAGIQHVYLNHVRVTGTVEELNAARALSFQFVDFEDDEWVEWIQQSKGGSLDDLAMILTNACQTHPSPDVLAECVKCLPLFTSADWNLWKLFPPQRTALKSAIRFIEQAIDKVALWPDSGPLWDASRRVQVLLGCDNESVRKLFLRQLQAVPMPGPLQASIEAAQLQFERSVGLAHVPANVSIASEIWRSWSALELGVVTDPSLFVEMIQKRASIDAPEYVGSLYARQVIQSPGSVEAWTGFSHYYVNTICSPKEQLSVLSRAVKNCPYEGQFWFDFFKLAILVDEKLCDRIVFMASSALREAMDRTVDCAFFFQKILLADCNRKLNNFSDVQSVRDSFQLAVSVLSPISPVLALGTFLFWLHAETFHPKLSSDDVAVALLGEFLENPEWAAKRSAATPLQWVQIAWLARSLTSPGEEPDDLELCRSVYALGQSLVEEKHKYIVMQDWALFEETFGSLGDVEKCTKRKLVEESTSNKRVRRKDSEQSEQTKPGRVVAKKTEEKKRNNDSPAESAKPMPNETNDLQTERAKVILNETSNLPAERVVEIHATCVYVQNLAFGVTEEGLLSFFESTCLTRPDRVLIVKNSLGKSRGFGYAEFASDVLAQQAVLQSGKSLMGRTLTIVPSNRGITVKKPKERMEHVVPDETAAARTNEYFRSLLGSKK